MRGWKSGRMKTSKENTRRYARGEHVMSKPEASLMRKIQSETGLSEEEVRSQKKFRKMLSDIQMSEQAKAGLNYRRKKQAEREYNEKHGINSKWNFGSEKAMFKQKTMQVLNGDKETTAELYKRYAGGLVDDKRPKGFFYRTFDTWQSETDVMKAIAKTDGQFVYSPDRNEVGFRYESSMTVFSLVYEMKA